MDIMERLEEKRIILDTILKRKLGVLNQILGRICFLYDYQEETTTSQTLRNEVEWKSH